MTSTRRRPVGPVGKIPARSLQRPTGPVYAGRTDLEREFRELIAGIKTGNGRVEVNPTYSLWCQAVRAQWELDNLEFEHPDKSWRSERPDDGMPLKWRRRDDPSRFYMVT